MGRRGDGRVYQRGKRFWIAYSVRGTEYREPAGATADQARARLHARLVEIAGGRFVGPRTERTLKSVEATGLGIPRERIYTRQMSGPIVYAWVREGVCLYVGESGKGLTRVFASHHVIKGVGPDDTIAVWDAPDDTSLRRDLEQQLIDALGPSLNRAGAAR